MTIPLLVSLLVIFERKSAPYFMTRRERRVRERGVERGRDLKEIKRGREMKESEYWIREKILVDRTS